MVNEYDALARDYLNSFVFIWSGIEAGELHLRFDAPALALLANSAELALKGLLANSGKSPDEVEGYGHNLELLFSDANRECGNRVASACNHVRQMWKKRLRDARDDFSASLQGCGISDQGHLREFGVLGNDEIGAALPEFRDDILWLSHRHRSNGSAFRYLKVGMDTRKHIRAFGLEEFTVPRSVSSGMRFLLDCRDQPAP
jgi:hypothetical protein